MTLAIFPLTLSVLAVDISRSVTDLTVCSLDVALPRSALIPSPNYCLSWEHEHGRRSPGMWGRRIRWSCLELELWNVLDVFYRAGI
ncbi:hypothetical protein HDV64DRAFT_93693 [Trichoderma sp. TUCIM 5745]